MVELAAVGLVSARPPPAVELSGGPRRRARLAGGRGPAWRSLPSASLRICAGGSGGGSAVPGALGGSARRRGGRWLRQRGVDGGEVRSPCSFTAKCSAAHGLRAVSVWMLGPAAILSRGGALRWWPDGGRRPSSSTPVVLPATALVLYPPRMYLCSVYLYSVLCTWYYVEYT